jgi:hypothetical protein
VLADSLDHSVRINFCTDLKDTVVEIVLGYYYAVYFDGCVIQVIITLAIGMRVGPSVGTSADGIIISAGYSRAAAIDAVRSIMKMPLGAS